ncbi:sugar transferase [uncultured Bacteroides sp.]|uniref:sugar transferase n=1 Tax=uncultured Bacteroides sp. TaxID=162156 RepID=UPI0026286297|nr:sugar transferase [uncultured Bacteroides sp.]
MYRVFFKRFLDIVFALCLFPFILLVIIIVGIMIGLFDKGPVFYNAPRMGKNGKIFHMFKFRSMKVNSPDLRNVDGSTFNSENDPRITPVGRFLRKTSIDELPQILNVLRGDMSFVGPRPSLTTTPYFAYNEIRKKRVSVRPGVTGYSQAYFRNSISQEEKFKYDCEYVDRISFALDVKVICRTIIGVLRRDNIY